MPKVKTAPSPTPKRPTAGGPSHSSKYNQREQDPEDSRRNGRRRHYSFLEDSSSEEENKPFFQSMLKPNPKDSLFSFEFAKNKKDSKATVRRSSKPVKEEESFSSSDEEQKAKVKPLSKSLSIPAGKGGKAGTSARGRPSKPILQGREESSSSSEEEEKATQKLQPLSKYKIKTLSVSLPAPKGRKVEVTARKDRPSEPEPVRRGRGRPRKIRVDDPSLDYDPDYDDVKVEEESIREESSGNGVVQVQQKSVSRKAVIKDSEESDYLDDVREKSSSGGGKRKRQESPPPSQNNEVEILGAAVAARSSAVVEPANEEEGNENSQLKHKFRITGGGEEDYLSLTNAKTTGHRVLIPERYLNSSVSYLNPRSSEFGARLFSGPPGDRTTSFFKTEGSVVTGYTTLEGKTVRPLQFTDEASQIVFWVLEGKITVRSSAYEEKENEKVLFGKELGKGCSLVVPANTPYTLENWGDDKVLLGYVLISSKPTAPSPTQALPNGQGSDASTE